MKASGPAAGAAGIRSGMRSRGGIGDVAAHDDDAAEEVFDEGRGLGLDGGVAGDHAAEEPARAVHSDEARHAGLAGGALRRGDGDLRDELGTEHAFALLVRPP